MAGDAFSRNQNIFNFQGMELESIKVRDDIKSFGKIYLFDWNPVMAWNRNQLHFFALESESV